MTSQFQRLNTRAAKVNGEIVMEIRRHYAAMHSYPVIREAINSKWNVLLSIQQITRIAKGQSWSQLPTIPTELEVDLTMTTNKLRSELLGGGRLQLQLPTDAVIQASLEKTLKMIGEENRPKRIDFDEVLRREEPEGKGMERLVREVNRLPTTTLATMTMTEVSLAATTTTTNVVDADKLLNELNKD